MNRAAAAFLALMLAGCQSTTPALNEESVAKPPSVPTLKGEELQAFVVGKSLRYNYYGAVSTYFADGKYGYRDYEVRDAGTYAIQGDTVCITFADGGRRCDRFALIGEDYFRIEEGGRQTKVDAIKPA